MSDSFVGNFTGQDYNNHTTVSIHAGSPPPGQPQPAPTPVVGPGTVTIVLDGEAGQIKAGGGGTHVGSIQLLNGLGKVIASLGNNPTGLQIYRAGGAGVLNALTAEIRGEPEGSLTLTNTNEVTTIRLSGKGASGWFGAPGVAGDLLVFAADAKGTDAADAAVWIKGSTGDVILQNADCAEDFEVADDANVEPGSVLTLSDNGPLTLSTTPYDRKVAGVISGAGGLRPGIVLGRHANTTNHWPIALSGKVFCKVDAQESPISVGDLLTTSPTPGHAMAARDHQRAFGAVIGKALAPLKSGTGFLPILIALQ
jgi:hypothetical protein